MPSSSQAVTILMPMGGLGSRFVDAGFTDPKPLIPVDGRPMFQKALSSFAGLPVPHQLVCVVRQEHIDQYDIDKLIQSSEPGAIVVAIPKVTRGAVETAVAARDYLPLDQPLIIMDCDLYISSQSYLHAMQQAIAQPDQPGFDGLLACFESQDPRYSYALTDQFDRVIRTAEKEVISHNAIAGAYGFSQAALFLEAADRLLQLPVADEVTAEEHLVGKVKKEYYISYLFNFLIKEGRVIRIAQVDTYHSFGTPEELTTYEQQV